MQQVIIKIFVGIFIFYVVICIIAFLIQGYIIFHPTKMEPYEKFQFPGTFEERTVTTNDGIALNTVLFKADSSKGVIFYLHGNGGSIESWGEIAPLYTNLGYDLWMVDYRGYGKSMGKNKNRKQFLGDVQQVYDTLKKDYDESKIIVLGYSLGSGPAAYIAANNNPKELILQAPYYSIVDEMKNRFSFLPGFLLKYNFETGEYLKNVKCPVVIFHGDQDEVIAYKSGEKLKPLLKEADSFITLKGQSHNGITENADYIKSLQGILEK